LDSYACGALGLFDGGANADFRSLKINNRSTLESRGHAKT
jgi:hypothetical protein